MTTNEADRTDDRSPATDVISPDEASDPPETSHSEQSDESRLVAGPEPAAPEVPETEPAPGERETGPVGIAQDDTVVDGDPSDAGPLLAEAAGYQDRWYEIQTGFVDEPRRAVRSAGELLTEMMDDLTRRLTTELGAFDARRRPGEDVSTEDLRVTFQRYRSFFDRLLAA